MREVQTLTLFVGNNRLQLEQVGVRTENDPAQAAGDGRIIAVMLRPIGVLAMIRLMLKGAMGTLGEAHSVEHFAFKRMVVRPTPTAGRRPPAAGGKSGIRRRSNADARATQLPGARQTAVFAKTPPASSRMSAVLQISDPHFGTEQAPVVNALAALAQQQKPDLIVLSGDITQRARPAQFAAARALVDGLGIPVLAIAGNHDIPLFDLWTRWRRPYSHYCAAFGSDLEPVHASADLMVVCVNTTRAWRHKDGEVSAPLIDRVAQALTGALTAQLRVVVVHQPVAVTRAEDVPNLLRGHATAL